MAAHQVPDTPATPNRRNFLGLLTYILGGLATVALAVPLIGYLIGPLRKRRSEWVSLGRLSLFPVGETRPATFVNPLKQPWDGMTANNTVYVRNLGAGPQGERLQVFAANCTHLGCPVTWFPQSGLFMCPCHGGVYYEDGNRASGPPPRRLFECKWEVKNGEVRIEAPHLPTLQNPLKPEDRG